MLSLEEAQEHLVDSKLGPGAGKLSPELLVPTRASVLVLAAGDPSPQTSHITVTAA